jgi:hypothetical protein
MNTKFKRHQEVILLTTPDKEYIEYHDEKEDTQENPNIPIVKGMKGKINLILPNGKYHVEILNEEGKTIAYAPFDEDDLEEA